ncbi:1-acyl-sn-glycerol-3-phosphate acyltransferase [Streptomyces sp. NBC_01549]|uniref:lysophospholipid acyltransferase family protein n=1 Tax=Streptomyces sp. NBC_01549 TaxID=2975874 RepID=UPI002256E3A2|nr:lysophospholipid acyltransferase family protein [Streptomyces sp. NBC_01549]MCX4597852.1 1-acyl-sn-glycerol-3-phosphate acyltransferase [Streptomyces sp. NBC_01549]
MPRRKIGITYRTLAAIARAIMWLLFRRDWAGTQHIPANGGFIAAVNHNSYVDPVAYGYFQYTAGRPPRFFAKQALFKGAFGRLMHAMKHIPVARGGAGALAALAAAATAVRAGEGVVFYPEGTLTRDPEMWPMGGRTGIARVALETGCPVIPVAQWGANLLLPPYGKMGRVFPRKTHQLLVGPPVDLSRFEGREPTPEVWREATEEIMAAITSLLSEIRGLPAPAVPVARRTPANPDNVQAPTA